MFLSGQKALLNTNDDVVKVLKETIMPQMRLTHQISPLRPNYNSCLSPIFILKILPPDV